MYLEVTFAGGQVGRYPCSSGATVTIQEPAVQSQPGVTVSGAVFTFALDGVSAVSLVNAELSPQLDGLSLADPAPVTDPVDPSVPVDSSTGSLSSLPSTEPPLVSAVSPDVSSGSPAATDASGSSTSTDTLPVSSGSGSSSVPVSSDGSSTISTPVDSTVAPASDAPPVSVEPVGSTVEPPVADAAAPVDPSVPVVDTTSPSTDSSGSAGSSTGTDTSAPTSDATAPSSLEPPAAPPASTIPVDPSSPVDHAKTALADVEQALTVAPTDPSLLDAQAQLQAEIAELEPPAAA